MGKGGAVKINVWIGEHKHLGEKERVVDMLREAPIPLHVRSQITHEIFLQRKVGGATHIFFISKRILKQKLI